MKIRPVRYLIIMKVSEKVVMRNSVIFFTPIYDSLPDAHNLLDLLMVLKITKSKTTKQVSATTNSKMNPTEFIFIIKDQ